VIFIHAHGRKLREYVKGNGVLINQGDDLFGNITSQRKADKIQASIRGMNHSVSFYKDILREDKLDTISKLSSGEIDISTEDLVDKWSDEVFMSSEGDVEDISLRKCHDYEYDQRDENPAEQATHRITFVYADPSVARMVKIGHNLFDEHLKIKLSDLIRHYARLKTPLPLCVVSLACPYDPVISRKPDSRVPSDKIVHASEAIGAYTVAFNNSTHDRERSRKRKHSPDREDYGDPRIFLKGLFDGKSKRKSRRKKRTQRKI
jgi:hypothetical protein